MKPLIVVILSLLSLTFRAQQKIDYLSEGNILLNENRPKDAELLFRKGLATDKTNLILKNQIALALINQNRNKEAQKTLNEILKTDSLNTAALWYSGINNYLSKPRNLREAIKYFEKVYPSIDKTSGQFFGVNYFIGNSYRGLLYSEGLNYEEVSRMLETLKLYTELQPNADDTDAISKFITRIETNRAPRNVKKWVITTGPASAEILKENLK